MKVMVMMAAAIIKMMMMVNFHNIEQKYIEKELICINRKIYLFSHNSHINTLV